MTFDYSLSKPTQEFYIPLPENDVYTDMLSKINPETVSGDIMNSLISVAISTDHTVIWYDHWEDSYEDDVKTPKQAKTEIWGDRNASNGCHPGIENCKDSDDVFMAGDAFVIQQLVKVPRNSNNWWNDGIKYDGGDRILASFPISINRGEFAENPGHTLAGGVEVMDTAQWGKSYEAPVGMNTPSESSAFKYSRLFVMSATNNNGITMSNGKKLFLNRGQTISLDVDQGDSLIATEPVQVTLCTGDMGPNAQQLRWFSLLPTESWSGQYLTPVGDGKTKLVVYNPNSDSITVKVNYMDNKGKQSTEKITLPSKSTKTSSVIPVGSGAELASTDGNFLALSISDNWGFPVQPASLLTPQVHVGWGLGCTENDCLGKTENSVVWITPLEDCDIFVDIENSGENYAKYSLKKLQSLKLQDSTDEGNMSGSMIFATEPNSGPTGKPVHIAAAWGQDPSVTSSSPQMNLGAALLPFSSVRVNAVVDKITATPGDVLTYTVTVQNVGQTEIKTGGYTIINPAVPQAEYILSSVSYSADGGASFFTVSDQESSDSVETTFPLDESGLPSQRDLPRRGGVHQIIFKVTVDPMKVVSNTIVNAGLVQIPNASYIPYLVKTTLTFAPGIKVENFVDAGEKGDFGCMQGIKEVASVNGDTVTYCFKITNVGKTYLNNIRLSNDKLDLNAAALPEILQLAPQETFVVSRTFEITGDLLNTIKAEANPVFANGQDIAGVPDVAATDSSGVKMVEYEPKIVIENTVYKGDMGTEPCQTQGVKKLSGHSNDFVTYCFKVFNKGNTHLSDIKVSSPVLDFEKLDVGTIEPNSSKLVSFVSKISKDLSIVAKATGVPTTPNGKLIPGLFDVQHVDSSEVNVQTATERRLVATTSAASGNCMQDAWEDAGNSQDLVCRAKEVYLENISTDRKTCNQGETVRLTINADIFLHAARYDLGWYVATDGGDALHGTCKIGGLTPDTQYKVTEGNKDVIIGSVAWNNDFKDGNDGCGDVFINGGGGCRIAVPFLKDVDVQCVDSNNDDVLDVSVCFSWRTAGTDGFCTLSLDDPKTTGNVPDLYPGTPSKCFCARYDIPNVTVVKPVSPASLTPC